MTDEGKDVLTLTSWSCCAQPPGAVAHPDQLPSSACWLPAEAPGTVAQAVQAAQQAGLSQPRDLDADDWWYRTTFRASGSCGRLCFDGLATLAEVWLNGVPVLMADNMFRAYSVDIGAALRPENEIVIVFRSLAADLKKRRLRPRWKTNLVDHQQLRWRRCSLLGSIPGWTPPLPIIGPWRPVRLDTAPFALTDQRLLSRVDGSEGVVSFQARLQSAQTPRGASIDVAGMRGPLAIEKDADGWLLHGSVRVADPPRWWPHTHGAQPLTACSLRVQLDEDHAVPCGNVGFRQLEHSLWRPITNRPDLALPADWKSAATAFIHVNGVPVYCRGACWTVVDITRPGAADPMARDLTLARDAGVNMLRVGGTMTYERDDFYRLCDELGILVWQDFMFANMDYPVDDADFAANIEAEARYQLSRFAAHPSIAVLCGNSEVEQQAAMVGAPREQWRNRWFGERLPQLCAEYLPGVPYVPSTPSGGVLPFHVRDGIAHYYGVGAYLRSPRELRQADVKFTPECLAFANVPEPATVSEVMEGQLPSLHDPRWKAGVPRDVGAGWDFEDVRDFYLQQLFGIDPVRLRSFDTQRYLQLSRVVSGEMMTQVFSEWRSGHSRNAGGLVWFFKDLRPGAGFGIIDSLGRPKAAYYYLRRAWQPRQLTLTDEGLDGLHLHVSNETSEALTGFIELLLLKDQHVVVARHEAGCSVSARGRLTLSADALLDRFHDLTYAYRFGPPQHELVIATLFDAEHRVLSEAFHFVLQREPIFLPAAAIDIKAAASVAGYEVSLRSDRFLQSVALEAINFLPDDNYFHLPPGRSKVVHFKRDALQAKDGERFRASLEALNLRNPVAIRVQDNTS